MRITGGELKGRTLRCPPGEIRPAMDRMRESVFAVLGDLSGKSVLDLFSGSGIIALEAASRGAGRVELVEKDPLKRQVLLCNAALAEQCPCGRVECHFIAAELFLRRAKNTFDVIFCDPPFPYRFRLGILQTVSARNLLSSQGTFVIHRPREDALPGNAIPLSKIDTREYGRSIVDFFSVSL
ncbi:MAG: 16S rRNA (guanine(966)-N(2))-methyltransferase RsmD [Treponemataceae bacterium]|nr:MAG: 16S rRNA (guanine(966)-N(2))-methyltransferase RsmD [Treponemataceae bacterium]GMO52944.1 MAG: 16S rRNA (guanine(966)-N(2))-methyltransferase RsmD [Treponemataceae bacterium]